MRKIQKKTALYLFGAVCALGVTFAPAASAAVDGCHWHCATVKCDARGTCTGSDCYQHCT